MVYDCVILGNETDLLLFRIRLVQAYVDKYIVVESARTFMGDRKRLSFIENGKQFEEYRSKIIYEVCPERPELIGWEYEYYQRNYIMHVLSSCAQPEDIVLISDVDEMPNYRRILAAMAGCRQVSVFNFICCYYYVNTVINEVWDKYVLGGKYKHVAALGAIGNRRTFQAMDDIRYVNDEIYGWHWSYLYGNRTDEYVKKLNSFSHSEFNSKYYKSRYRLWLRILRLEDVLEREGFRIIPKPLSAVYDDPEMRELISQEMRDSIYKARVGIVSIRMMTLVLGLPFAIRSKTLQVIKYIHQVLRQLKLRYVHR